MKNCIRVVPKTPGTQSAFAEYVKGRCAEFKKGDSPCVTTDQQVWAPPPKITERDAEIERLKADYAALKARYELAVKELIVKDEI